MTQNHLVVVRHPITRLLSGYYDIWVNNKHNEPLLVKMKSKIGKLIKQLNISSLDAYISTIMQTDDRHFHSYERSCYPCDVMFNTIVKIDDPSETKIYFEESKKVSENSRQLFSKIERKQANVGKKSKRSWREDFQKARASTIVKFLKFY